MDPNTPDVRPEIEVREYSDRAEIYLRSDAPLPTFVLTKPAGSSADLEISDIVDGVMKHLRSTWRVKRKVCFGPASAFVQAVINDKPKKKYDF